MKECVEASGGEESFNNALAQSGLAEIEIENKLDKEKVKFNITLYIFGDIRS